MGDGTSASCLASKGCHFEIDCDGDGAFEVRSSTFGQTQSGEHYAVDIDDSEATVQCEATGIPHHVAIRGNISEVKLSLLDESRLLRQEYISIDQWGDIEWSCINIFSTCMESCNCTPTAKVKGIVYNASDNPNLKNVESLAYWAAPYSCFLGSVENWDVSNVKYMGFAFVGYSRTQVFKPLGGRKNDRPLIYLSQQMTHQPIKNMHRMFRDESKTCKAFNQPLNNWDVSHVRDMEAMFFKATSFNQPLNNWDVSHVENMRYMFYGASSFNQPLDNWDVSQVTNMNSMFDKADSLEKRPRW